MKFRNEFWLILFWEYISPNLFAVWDSGRVGWWVGAYLSGVGFQRGGRCLRGGNRVSGKGGGWGGDSEIFELWGLI
jgi:hypothetical protein